jgi:hypothetical protein
LCQQSSDSAAIPNASCLLSGAFWCSTGKLNFVWHGCQHAAAAEASVKQRLFAGLPDGESLAQLSAGELEERARKDLGGDLADAMHSFGSSVAGEHVFAGCYTRMAADALFPQCPAVD